MSIRRAPRRKSTPTPTALLEDERLSWKAKGLAAYLLAKPPQWRIDASALARRFKDGRDAVLSGLKELEEAGYLVRSRYQNRSGQWATESVLFECPEDAAEVTEVGFSDFGSPDFGSPEVGAPYAIPLSVRVEQGERSSPALTFGEDVDRLCTLLADLIEANGSKRPTVTNTWRVECDRLIRLDGKTPAKIEACIRWCQQDPFWRANILSMPTLRKQYERLRLNAQRPPVAQNGRRAKGQDTLDKLAARRAERNGAA